MRFVLCWSVTTAFQHVTFQRTGVRLMALRAGDFVKVDWSLSPSPTPGVFDQGVCALEIGNGYVEPLHASLKEMAVGEKKTTKVENFFGAFDERLTAAVPLANAPPGLKKGDKVKLATGMTAMVTNVDDESVTIDANPEFAGETVEMAVEVLEQIDAEKLHHATFGGGCFWGIELAYQRLPGVLATKVGYANGQTDDPSYEQVCSGTTGHTEAVQVTYDPDVVSFSDLCDLLWDRLGENRFALNQVGNDRGTQYRHGIYFHSDDAAAVAKASFEREQAKHPGRPIVTEVLPLTVFYDAEEYHQQYLQKGGQSAKKQATETIRCYG